MALSDHKITDAAIAEKGVVAAPDQLSGSARTNKMLFDRLIREAVKADYNGLIDALMAATGAGEIGAAVDGLAGATIQSILNSIKTALDSKISSAVTEAALALKSDKAVTNKHIKSVELDEATGTFTFTRENGTKIMIDTALEKVAVNFTYDEDSQSLILTLADGSTETVSLAAFVTTTEFEDSGTIEWSALGSKVKATVKEGSITDTMLSSALKTMLLGYVNRAAGSATNAAASERNAAASAAQAREAAADTHGFMAGAGEYAQDAKNEAEKAAGSASAAASSAGAAGSSATRAASSAASAAESIKYAPRINSSGKWELWDATKNAYVATEYTAIGKNGTRGLGWYQYSVTASNPQVFSWTGRPAAPKWGEGDWLYDPDNGNVGLCTVRIDNADGSGHANITYKGTLKGTDGITPTIGENGNWYIGDTDTGVSAGGASSVFRVIVVTGPDPDKLSANKTFAEIKSAYSSGSMVVVKQGSALYELTYVSDAKAEFTRVNATYYDVLSCSNSGAPQEVDIWQLNRTKRVNYDTKYKDIGLKTVPVAIKELQDKASPTVTDADAGKYLHVNATTKELEWAEIGGGTSSVFYVEVNHDTGTDSYTSDKTFSEIKAAYEAGNTVVSRMGNMLMPLSTVSSVLITFSLESGTNYWELTCNSGDTWSYSTELLLGRETKYTDIGRKTVLEAISALQDKSVPVVTDTDAGKYLHVNASKELEWAGLSFTDDGSGNISVDGATAQSVNQFLQSLTFPGLNFKYINPLNSGTYSNPYGVYVGSGASLVDTILAKTVPGVYTVYMNKNATDVPAAAAAASSSLRGLVVLSQIKKHYAIIMLVDQLSNFYVQYIQNDVGGGWKQMPTSDGGSDLPAVTAADAGKFLRVSSSGSWAAETVANANGGEF